VGRRVLRLLALRTILGLDAGGGRLRTSAHVPKELGKVRLEGLKVGRL
jgi:hypothetical protein